MHEYVTLYGWVGIYGPLVVVGAIGGGIWGYRVGPMDNRDEGMRLGALAGGIVGVLAATGVFHFA